MIYDELHNDILHIEINKSLPWPEFLKCGPHSFDLRYQSSHFIINGEPISRRALNKQLKAGCEKSNINKTYTITYTQNSIQASFDLSLN